MHNQGKRIFEFKDGTKISVNFCKEKYSNTFFGTPRQESFGEMVFKDLTNGFECIIKLASVKKKYNISYILDLPTILMGK